VGPDHLDDERVQVMEQQPGRLFVTGAHPFQTGRHVKTGLRHIPFRSILRAHFTSCPYFTTAPARESYIGFTPGRVRYS
jgi:hypothetical protein